MIELFQYMCIEISHIIMDSVCIKVNLCIEFYFFK